MRKIDMATAVVEVVVSLGVGFIVGNAVNATTPSNVRVVKKACIVAGAFVLGSMLGDKAVQYAEEKIKDGVTMIKGLVMETKNGI